jgi:hypothetical protein
MTPEEEQRLKDLIKDSVKEQKPGWLTLIERTIIPVILCISTVVLGVVGWRSNETQIKLTTDKQKLDSINTDRSFQLNLVEQYSQDISSSDTLKRNNANYLLRLMDSSFAKKVLSYPWYSSYQEKEGVVYNKEGNDIIKSQSDILLSYSNIKVYYSDASQKTKATSINKLLKDRGAQSAVSVPNYSLSKVNNQIVYYNVAQLNYCKAVQNLLQKSNYGNFEIRQSSGASQTIPFFKIYVTQ